MVPRSLSDARPPSSGPRPRCCLLKGCERWFRPRRPQCRYCSDACRQAARRWRRWQAQQKYRASPNGRQHRQEQARRYRQRGPTRPPPSPPISRSEPEATAVPLNPDDPADATEGKRLPDKGEKGPLRPCDRPGCYTLFAAGAPGTTKRFCGVLCRRALRRVLDREARRRRRRRHGLRRPGRRPRSPPRR